MTLILHDSFEYNLPHKSIQPRCDLRVYQLGLARAVDHRGFFVVVYGEPADYEGYSVTNGAEHIATQLVASRIGRETIRDRARVLWVEHWPKECQRIKTNPENFDLVFFDWRWNECYIGTYEPCWCAISPTWHRVSREWLEQLLGEEFDGR